MVRTVVVACFVLLLAIPALAQDDYPKIQTSLGYANLGLFNFATGDTSRHSGFSNQTGFNLTKTWGLENYMGIYSLGGGVTLIADMFGGKATYRASKIAPYALAGIGIGYFTASTSYGYAATSKFAHRFGGGVDFPIGDTLAWKVEVSRMGFKNPLGTGGWINGTNIATGIVFTLAQ
jgi:Outer membrane protein beta-barrel domain